MSREKYLPDDGFTGTLIGRVWKNSPGSISGPSPVLIRDDNVYDLSHLRPTVSQLLNDFGADEIKQYGGATRIDSYNNIIANTLETNHKEHATSFIAPVDIQAIKACGVTFVCSMLERVIEERAGGDFAKANEIREQLQKQISVDLSEIVPGSKQAETLKTILIKQSLWSQYLEVGIGPYAEIFTKSQPLSSVGLGQQVGISDVSHWNNPEPEVVLIVNNKAQIQGACLGNDVNLRDIEGRSALLLGKAKDNNASCAIGPFIRLFDDSFDLDDVRHETIQLEVKGKDGFILNESSPMSLISRDVADLVSQTLNKNHQYPDGLALFTGTLFAPIQDRDIKGLGFTHKIGDRVRISSKKLGCLENQVTYSHLASPWYFGIAELFNNLSRRGLLNPVERADEKSSTISLTKTRKSS